MSLSAGLGQSHALVDTSSDNSGPVPLMAWGVIFMFFVALTTYSCYRARRRDQRSRLARRRTQNLLCRYDRYGDEPLLINSDAGGASSGYDGSSESDEEAGYGAFRVPVRR